MNYFTEIYLKYAICVLGFAIYVNVRARAGLMSDANTTTHVFLC